MRLFKYLIFLSFLFIANQAYSACEPNLHGSFESNLADPPYTICSSHTDFGSSKCIMEVYTMEQHASGWLLFAKTNGQTCTSETQLNQPTQYECTQDVCPVTEQQPCPSTHQKGMYNGQLSCVKIKEQDENVLQCIDDYCFNPENKICPSGYQKGTFNGQAVCSKKQENEEEQGECEGENCSSATSIIEAIEKSNNDITSSIDNLKQGFTDAINGLTTKLQEWIDKLSGEECTEGEECPTETNPNDGDGTGNGGDNGDYSGVDTSGLQADVPYIEQNTNKTFDTNLFSSSSSCPPDNTLNINILNRSYSYTFEYTYICDGLGIIGFFFLALAYGYSAKIVVSA